MDFRIWANKVMSFLRLRSPQGASSPNGKIGQAVQTLFHAKEQPFDLIDLSTLEHTKNLLKEHYSPSLAHFFDEVSTCLKGLKTALDQRNIEGLIRPAQTIKSAGRRIGAALLSDVARQLEFAARNALETNATPSFEEFLEKVSSLEDIFQKTKEALTSNKD